MCEQVEEWRCSFLVYCVAHFHSGVAHLGAVMSELIVSAGISAVRPI